MGLCCVVISGVADILVWRDLVKSRRWCSGCGERDPGGLRVGDSSPVEVCIALV